MATASPCVKVCVVEGATGLCLGCRRTLAEIAGWAGFSDAKRAEIWSALAARRLAMDSPPDNGELT